jgi:ATP-dependent protease HslVU (ClpYQ) peptidase subunit
MVFVKNIFNLKNMTKYRSTTVIAVKHNDKIAIGADGQATFGNTRCQE